MWVKSFAETLTRLMKEKGINKKSLSEKTGIPRTTITEWAAGRTPQVSTDLIKLSRFFGVSLEYLVTGESEESTLLRDIVSAGGDFIQVHQGVYRITVEKKKE